MLRWMSLLLVSVLGPMACSGDNGNAPTSSSGDMALESSAVLSSEPMSESVPESPPKAVVENVFAVDLPGGETVEFACVWIEPGKFVMGSPPLEHDREDNEGPQHEVAISRGFWLGKYEIAQAQWESVMHNAPWSGQYYVQEDPNCPAMYISWHDVQEFMRRLNEAEGAAVYRLPTEAEWEYACRAGATTRWSFGDDENRLGEYAWHKDNAWDQGEQYAHSEGVKLPNPWGLYDMHGNVWEWVQDWFSEIYYSNSPSVDPQGAETGIRRVRKGADFHYYVRGTRSARRGRSVPDFRKPTIGARLLRQEP